jgi:hypothetical protein
MTSSVRSATPQEQNCVKLLDYADTLADRKKLFGTLSMQNTAIDAMTFHDVAVPIKIEPLKSATPSSSVTFTLPQLYRYVHFVCRITGLRIEVDGTVLTRDGHELPRSFVDSVTPNKQ